MKELTWLQVACLSLANVLACSQPQTTSSDKGFTQHAADAILPFAEELDELRKKEKEMGYTPDWELDAFMKAEIRKGKKESIVTDLVIKLLGLDVSYLQL